MKNDFKKHYSFFEITNSIVTGVNERAKSMIMDRFGLGKKDNILSLSQIGKKHSITRERVRQIINESIGKIKKETKKNELFKKAEADIIFVIKSKYGIMPLEELLNYCSKNEKDYNYIKFILFCSEEVNLTTDKNLIKSVYYSDFDFKKLKYIHNIAENLLKDNGNVIDLENFFHMFMKEKSVLIDLDNFLSFLNVSKRIKKSVFNKWGMFDWEEVSPKNIRDKAYLIVKEKGKPLHFKKVAKLIDKYGLSKKESHPQTVHNELIKDERFVLIGRGTYALSEWGYTKGTVKDVIKEVLKKQNRSLHRDEIVEKVLSVRSVKTTTILINLNNHFKKTKDNKYFLEEC